MKIGLFSTERCHKIIPKISLLPLRHPKLFHTNTQTCMWTTLLSTGLFLIHTHSAQSVRESLSVKSALIWPQGLDKEKGDILQEFPFGCCIRPFVQQPAGTMSTSVYSPLLLRQYCRCFIPCGRCWDRGGGAQLRREKLSGKDKLWPVRLRNKWRGSSAVKEPEGLYFVYVCVLQECRYLKWHLSTFLFVEESFSFPF